MKHHSEVLIVGGIVRPIILQRIRRALKGMAVEWIPTRESDASSYAFTAQVRRPETSLVVILTGLIRHQHAHDLVSLARQYGKRVLHLHRSPNPTRIKQALSTPKGTRV